MCFGVAVIVLFMVLVAKIFGFNFFGYWLGLLLEWCSFLMKKMTDETIIKINQKNEDKDPLTPFLLSILAYLSVLVFSVRWRSKRMQERLPYKPALQD